MLRLGNLHAAVLSSPLTICLIAGIAWWAVISTI